MVDRKESQRLKALNKSSSDSGALLKHGVFDGLVKKEGMPCGENNQTGDDSMKGLIQNNQNNTNARCTKADAHWI